MPSLPKSILTIDQLVPLPDLMQSEYYTDFLSPQSIHSMMVVYLKSGNRLLGVIGLFRPREAESFSHREKAKVKVVAPNPTRSLQKAIDHESLINSPVESLSRSLKKFGVSRRESEVAQIVSQGLKNAEIANKLYIAEVTVEKHLESIYQKCGVKNRTSLAYLVMHLSH